MGETRFLNVDLDIESEIDLDTLIDAVADDLFVLNPGQKRRISLEHRNDGMTADATIKAIYNAYIKLQPNHHLQWHACTKRSFNIGIQSDFGPTLMEFPITAATLQMLTEMQAELVITVYAPEDGPVTG